MWCGRRGLGLAFILALVAASSWAAAFDPSDYTATNLGGVADSSTDLTGPTNFWAYSLTDSGQVTGYGMQQGSNGTANEVLGSWNATTGFVANLNTPITGGYPNSPYVYNYVPVAGNNTGTIVWTDQSVVGHVYNSAGSTTAPAALLWVNSAGLAVGGADPVGGNGPGIVYNTVTQTTVAANLPGVGYYINDAGQAGGTENGFTEGFVWSQTASNGWAQGVTPLPQLGSVLGISQDGQYAVGQDPGITNGVVYDNVAKSATTITGGTAISVNNNGWVGGSSSTANYAYIDPYPSAWLWDGTTLHTTDLSAMLPTGYTAVSVMAVNDSDDILMWGVDGDQWDNVHAFLLTPTATPPTQHPGDANGDGRVDVNDLTIVLTNFGQSGMAWSQGNMDSDPTGTVDVNDLTIVLSNYGWTASASVAAVPEPGVLALAAGGLVGLLAFAWRSRK